MAAWASDGVLGIFGVGLVRSRGKGRSLNVGDFGGQLSEIFPELP